MLKQYPEGIVAVVSDSYVLSPVAVKRIFEEANNKVWSNIDPISKVTDILADTWFLHCSDQIDWLHLRWKDNKHCSQDSTHIQDLPRISTMLAKNFGVLSCHLDSIALMHLNVTWWSGTMNRGPMKSDVLIFLDLLAVLMFDHVWSIELRKDLISSRAPPGRLVVRPDSGESLGFFLEPMWRMVSRCIDVIRCLETSKSRHI